MEDDNLLVNAVDDLSENLGAELETLNATLKKIEAYLMHIALHCGMDSWSSPGNS